MSDFDYREVTKEDWSGGEIAPSYQGRISSPLYRAGSALMYNVLARNGGGWRRRPGTRFAATLVCDSNIAHFFPFTAVLGQQFMLAVHVVSSVAKIAVYSLATHALVTTLTTNVSAYTVGDLPAITFAQTNGMTWLFMSGVAAGTPGGVRICYVSNAADDGSGAWSATQPTFTNDTGGAGAGEKFDATNHYPGCGEFYAGRLFVSGANFNPLAQYACKIPAPPAAQTYLVFTVPASPVATDGIYLLQNDMNAPAVRHLFASQRMIAGTERSVWQEIEEDYPAPATYSMKKSSSYGMLRYARPVQVGNVALYLGVESRTLRALSFSLQRGSFADSSLSDHAEHLFSKKAVDFCVLLKPDATAFVRMDDGSLVTATVRQEDDGFSVKAGCAFAQHALGGSGVVKTMCALTNTNYDELWLGVVRGSTFCIEYLYLDDINSTSQAGSYYVDCGQVQITAGQMTFTGLPSPLEGQSVAALGDGGVLPRKTVTGGQVTYDIEVDTLNVGFPYYSAWQDVRPFVPAKGGLLGFLRKIEKQWLLVYNSMGGWIGKDAPADPLNAPEETLTTFWPDMQTYGVQLYGSAPAWRNGFFPIDDALEADANGQVYLAIVDPVPFNLVAVTTRFALSEV